MGVTADRGAVANEVDAPTPPKGLIPARKTKKATLESGIQSVEQDSAAIFCPGEELLRGGGSGDFPNDGRWLDQQPCTLANETHNRYSGKN
ncbi:hypothetical protein [Paenibacillus sp.]|uniref:hypothetical protein n=1 Tax=Paenibacillus sp. TaxID=58172 RepID=UPI00281A5D08|nr:hypothetical protein [Paenibacillus sp.]MDR0267727.1 hypothetical protein [Paenibacillus sp.]